MLLPQSLSFPTDLSAFTDIIDVRSPAEFAEDHLPGALNLPVLSNDQRHEVGLLYKSKPFEARRMGAALITANIHEHFNTYFSAKDKKFRPLLYCWRGGMRSNSLAAVLTGVGWRTHVIEGGYKHWRQFVSEELIRFLDLKNNATNISFRVLGGLTGTGKTRLLQSLADEGAQVLDLEALANHKGSLLGKSDHHPAQPSQRLFESRLHQRLHQLDLTRPIYVEAESNKIGQIHCPAPLWRALSRENSNTEVIQLHLDQDQRTALLREDYPHFITQPTRLIDALQPLRRLRGHDLIDQWETWIKAQDWDNFLASILTDHYDLAYRPPGDEKSNYAPPQSTLTVHGISPEHMQKAAQEILG